MASTQEGGFQKSYQATFDSNDPPNDPPAYTRESGDQPLPPPSYNDVERNAGPPPSYDSIYGKVKAVRENSEGNLDFVKKIVVLIVGTIGFTIFLGLMLAVPIAMIAMGAKYLNDCPVERFIPIYLIVSGSFGAARNLFTLGRRFCQKDEEDEEKTKANPVASVVDCFMFAWFIAGNVWIYGTKGDFSTDPAAANFCDPTLYWFAFWITTAVYIVIGCSCCCICVCGILAACSGGESK